MAMGMAGESRTAIQLTDLPNEILAAILSHHPTTSLVPLSLTSHLFRKLVRHIVYQRLLGAANTAKGGREVVLECFHPAARFGSPSLGCEFVGTEIVDSGKGDVEEGGSGTLAGKEEEGGRGEEKGEDMNFTTLYATFLPLQPVVSPMTMGTRAAWAHAAGVQLSPSSSSAFSSPFLPSAYLPDTSSMNRQARHAKGDKSANDTKDGGREKVHQTLYLDTYESFTQLCTTAKLVSPSSPSSPIQSHSAFSSHPSLNPGLYNSATLIASSTMRVWREWLAERCRTGEEGVVWVDNEETVGVKMSVRGREGAVTGFGRGGVVGDRYTGNNGWEGGEVEVGYEVGFEALLIKTTRLLLATEQSETNERERRGMYCGLDSQYIHAFVQEREETASWERWAAEAWGVS